MWESSGSTTITEMILVRPGKSYIYDVFMNCCIGEIWGYGIESVNHNLIHVSQGWYERFRGGS